MTEDNKKRSKELSRREFLKDAGLLVGGTAIGSTVLLAACGEAETITETATVTSTAPGGTTTVTSTSTVTDTKTLTDTTTAIANNFVCPFCGQELDTLSDLKEHVESEHEGELPKVFPASTGYIVVDSTSCIGCQTCMLACSMVHEGANSLALSRIQVIKNTLERFPNDIEIAQCRQCVNPLCVQACPIGACHVDTENGNVRVIDEEKCLGDICGLCSKACPFMPYRVKLNPTKNVSMKCDLCLNTPYWGEEGGPSGKQACVEACPQMAIKFTEETPSQQGTAGYNYKFEVAAEQQDSGEGGH